MQDIRNFIGRAANTTAPTGRPTTAQPKEGADVSAFAADSGMSPEVLQKLRERREAATPKRCHPGDEGFRSGRPGRAPWSGRQEDGVQRPWHHHHQGQWAGRQQDGVNRPWARPDGQDFRPTGRQDDGVGRPWARGKELGKERCPGFNPESGKHPGFNPDAGNRHGMPLNPPPVIPGRPVPAFAQRPGVLPGPGPALGGDFDGPENLGPMPTRRPMPAELDPGFGGPEMMGPEMFDGPEMMDPGFEGPEGPDMMVPGFEGPDMMGPEGPDFDDELDGPVPMMDGPIGGDE